MVRVNLDGSKLPPRITDRWLMIYLFSYLYFHCRHCFVVNPTAAFCCKILLAKVIFLFQIIVFITFFNLFFVFSAPATKQICHQIAFPDIRLSELLDDSHDECFAYWTKWEE